MRTVGVVVNPIAGMGGRVGLKGTDGKVAEARARGAEPRAPERARRALESLAAADETVRVLAYGDPMGAAEARTAGFDPVVVGHPASEETTAADTRAAVQAFFEWSPADADGDSGTADEGTPDRGVDLVLFVGGDGTALDVAETLAALDANDGDDAVPALGAPAGVKVYSATFAVTPEAAGEIAATFTETERREVNDIDEAAYREGEVRAEPRAVLRVPVGDALQASKQTPGGSVAALAAGVADDVAAGVTYVLGPGGTVGTIKEALGIEGTPLGVDVYRDGQRLVADATEEEILAALGDRNRLVVSPLGGQGFLLGRGNDQLSPAVVRRCDLEIVASRTKLDGLGVLRVDTGDPALDEELQGWHRVRVGRFERRLVEVV
jgi:predicted polyphosphate/ATP-dependent NAD kinase